MRFYCRDCGRLWDEMHCPECGEPYPIGEAIDRHLEQLDNPQTANRSGQAGDKREDAAMRPTCLLCVRKHIGKAEAQMNEARMGYKHHRGFAIGNLSEAADECLQLFPDLAEEIRKQWKAYELDEDGYEVMTIYLLRRVENLLEEWRSTPEGQAMMEDHKAGHPERKTPTSP